MIAPHRTPDEPVTPQRLAEAGVWISRLHGGARDRTVDSGLRRWLQANPDNARAFELATEVWNDAERLRRFAPWRHTQIESRPRWHGLVKIAAAVVVIFAVGVVWIQQRGVTTTGVGEQRQMVLEDGTRVFLNTNTRVVVTYDKHARYVELQRGEALFNVAKRPDWPFIVVAGDRQVQALGTSFIVRKDDDHLAVTLMEGKVSVAPAQPLAAVEPPPAQSPRSVNTRDDRYTLVPGQRITIDSGTMPQIDTPSVEKTTAWRRGQVILDDTPLQAAAEEMNRYNTTKLVIDDAAARQLPINGLFQAGDSVHFANAVADAYGMRMVERGNTIILSGKAAD